MHLLTLKMKEMSCSLPTGYNEFKLRVNIKTTVEKAYKSIATPGGLESWFLRTALFQDIDSNIRSAHEFIRNKDIYSMTWYGYPDVVSEKGRVLLANGENEFSITFSNASHVHFRIYEEQGEIIVELTEDNLPTDDETKLKHYVSDLKGWTFYLVNLKSVLEGGLDLRNRREELKDVITS